MDPNPVLRWVMSRVASRLADPKRLSKKRTQYERNRVKSGQPHVVEYFHQVDDGYSHLAAQVLQPFIQRYDDIRLVVHLVSGPQGGNAAEPGLLAALSRSDAIRIAPYYRLQFPAHGDAPSVSQLKLAGAILAKQSADQFIERAGDVGQALWANDGDALNALAERYGRETDETLSARVSAGDDRRQRLKHYSGAMFYYGGEWYWGVDRLFHLERRLAELGADRQPGRPMIAPRPNIEVGTRRDDGRLTLEIFPSLRSPYTAISFDRAVKLAQDTGVRLRVRPVLPMVMRGVPATREKGLYIFADAAREARAAGVAYGNFRDPIGDPARRCYSLYAWAREQGKEVALLSSFLRGAFAQGINTNNDKGLRAVVESAGLRWQQAQSIVGQPGWEAELETNRQALYESGLWGVPSFRLLAHNGEQILALWGQDRLWLIAKEIQRALG